MQDRTYSDLLFLIQSLIGAGNLTTEEQGSIESFINRRAHEAFETSQTWPRFLVSSEERTLVLYELLGASSATSTSVNGQYKFFGINSGSFESGGGSATADTNIYQNTSSTTTFIYKNSSNAWVVATSISPTDTRSSDGKISLNSSGTVQFTEADTTKNDALENVTTWTPRTGSNLLSVVKKYIVPYAEGGVLTTDSAKTNIGEFLKIYRKQAFLNDSSLEYDFFVDFNGGNILNIANTTDNTAFVTYKKELPQYTITSTDIPGEWFFFIAHGAYADFLRMEGRTEQSITEEGVAQGYLAQELEKVDNMSNNNVFRRFSTHGTRQSR
tara:strand:- start:233 stop:1213 length:981 start_codon:yes stop_codon:yes gene_type:complete